MHISVLFLKWLEELSRWNKVEDFVHFIEGENSPYREKVRIYTRDHSYTIVVNEYEDGRTYLGCVVNTRKPRAGEKWTRGNDLADGDFSRRTWDKIKNDIISYELVKISKPAKQVPVSENPVGPDKE